MSGSNVAYHLRVNKYIDRQMFLEALSLVDRYVPLVNHGYISMAGAYLEDCRVVHQSTRISRMYSIELKAAVVARQEVNRPYGFVQCNKGDSKQVVDNFDDVRISLGGSDTNVVVWLDYAVANDRLSQLQELESLVPKLIAGDVVRVTLNAHRPTLGEDQEYRRLDPDRKPSTLATWRYERLAEQLGSDYMPGDRGSAEHMESKDGFYRTMIRAAKHVVIRAIQPREELLAFPVLSTAYDDQHGMITTMFVVIKKTEEARFKQLTQWDEWPHKPGHEWDDYAEIQVPHLSMRERHILHRTIDRGCVFGGDRPAFVTAKEFEQYQAHYRRYPTFAPLDVV